MKYEFPDGSWHIEHATTAKGKRYVKFVAERCVVPLWDAGGGLDTNLAGTLTVEAEPGKTFGRREWLSKVSSVKICGAAEPSARPGTEGFGERTVVFTWEHQPASDESIGMTRVAGMLDSAREAGATKIRVRFSDDVSVYWSSNRGAYGVTNGRAYGDPENKFWGWLRDGALRLGHWIPAEVVEQLRQVAADPVAASVAYGHGSGNCSYCGRGLKTAESRTAGYGPVCAERYGLPWGATDGWDAEREEIKAALAN